MGKHTQDALIACSLIVLQHCWADPPSPSEEQEQEPSDSRSTNSLFSLAAGLRHIIISTWETKADTVFGDVVCFKHAKPFPRRLEDPALTVDLQHFSDLILQARHDAGFHDGPAREDYVRASDRLVTVLSLSYDPMNPSSSHLTLDVARYFFLWPAMCPEGFRALVERKDPSCLMLMLAYSHGIERMLPESFWWMRGKASLMSHELVSAIGRKALSSLSRAADECALGHVFDVILGRGLSS